MGDLISRSALLAYLENEKRKIKADSKKYRIHEEAVAGMKASLQAIENKVNEMPTAFDVEKVVAMMDEALIEFNDGTNCTECVFKDVCDDGYEGCVETIVSVCKNTVRKGGVE